MLHGREVLLARKASPARVMLLIACHSASLKAGGPARASSQIQAQARILPCRLVPPPHLTTRTRFPVTLTTRWDPDESLHGVFARRALFPRVAIIATTSRTLVVHTTRTTNTSGNVVAHTPHHTDTRAIAGSLHPHHIHTAPPTNRARGRLGPRKQTSAWLLGVPTHHTAVIDRDRLTQDTVLNPGE